MYTDTSSEIGSFEYISINENVKERYQTTNDVYSGIVHATKRPDIHHDLNIAVECYLKGSERVIKIDTDTDGDLHDEKEYIINQKTKPIPVNFTETENEEKKKATIYVVPMESQFAKAKSKNDFSNVGLKFLVTRRSVVLGLRKNYSITVFVVNGKNYSSANSTFIVNESNKMDPNPVLYQIGDVLYLEKNKLKISGIDSAGRFVTIENEGEMSKQSGYLNGDIALDISGINLQTGEKIYYSEGDFTLVEFWGPWCGPCKAITDSIKKLNLDYKNKLTVIGIATDRSEEIVKTYIKEKGITYPIIYENFNGANVSNYVIKAYPTFILINKRRKIIYRYSGIDQFHILKDLINENVSKE